MDFLEFAIPRIVGALLAIWMGASVCKADSHNIAPVRPIESRHSSPVTHHCDIPNVAWTKPIRPSIQIKGRKGVPPAQYDLSDLSLDGDLTNARTFFKTHEVIFWLKGSLQFSTFSTNKRVDLGRASVRFSGENLTMGGRLSPLGNRRSALGKLSAGAEPKVSYFKSPWPRRTLPPDPDENSRWLRELSAGKIDIDEYRSLIAGARDLQRMRFFQ